MNAPDAAAADELDLFPVCCRDLRSQYGLRRVLNGVSFAIPKGAVLGLVGSNGAGKTTLIRILVGLLMPQAGKAFILGEPALRMTDASKTRLGYVPQQPESLSWITVETMLNFVGSFYPNWDADYVLTSLMRWHIPMSQPLAKLSAGERQRVALIRALAIRPEVLILDEPASALDPVARRDLLREIALRAADHAMTVLFSTHIVSDLERVASHVIFLDNGKLLLDAAMDDLKDTHGRLILSRTQAGDIGRHLPGEISRRRHPDGALSIVLTRSPGEAWSEQAASGGGMIEPMSLEDLFIELTDKPGSAWFLK